MVTRNTSSTHKENLFHNPNTSHLMRKSRRISSIRKTRGMSRATSSNSSHRDQILNMDRLSHNTEEHSRSKGMTVRMTMDSSSKHRPISRKVRYLRQCKTINISNYQINRPQSRLIHLITQPRSRCLLRVHFPGRRGMNSPLVIFSATTTCC